MTNIVREENTGKMFAFTKGADDVIINLCKSVSDSQSKVADEFASKGLRTLMFAMRELDSHNIDVNTVE